MHQTFTSKYSGFYPPKHRLWLMWLKSRSNNLTSFQKEAEAGWIFKHLGGTCLVYDTNILIIWNYRGTRLYKLPFVPWGPGNIKIYIYEIFYFKSQIRFLWRSRICGNKHWNLYLCWHGILSFISYYIYTNRNALVPNKWQANCMT